VTFDEAIPYVVGGGLVVFVVVFAVMNRAKSRAASAKKKPARPARKEQGRGDYSLPFVLIAFGLLLAGIGIAFRNDLADVEGRGPGGRTGRALFRAIGTYLGPTGVLVFMLLFGGVWVAYGAYLLWSRAKGGRGDDDVTPGREDG
jgi:hypothetical protein